MKELLCKVCRSRIKATQAMLDAEYVLCPIHSAVLNDTAREQFLMRHVASEVARGEVSESVDAGGCRYFVRVPLKPPRVGIVSYDTDGFARHVDTASPTGVTFRPGVDRCFGGSDPRLDKLREPQEDLDLDPDHGPDAA